MARPAAAQEVICALRREIAKIEGTLPERLDAPAAARPEADAMVLRRDGTPARNGGTSAFLETGISRFDTALGGGVPKAALTEIHSAETRDAGAAAGFALSLASLLKDRRKETAPILWIGTSEIFREAGIPYAPGLASAYGLRPEELLVSEAAKLSDALWIAEEAARLKELSAVFLELRGNPDQLDLTATRRLHRRTMEAGRPFFLIREAAWPEPTAAPVRLLVSAASATPRKTLAGPFAASIGGPAFAVSINKSRTARGGEFILEWNPDERCFAERQPENPGLVVSPSAVRPDSPAAPGAILAFGSAPKRTAARLQPSRKERAARRRAR